jgi:hypothetical protein
VLENKVRDIMNRLSRLWYLFKKDLWTTDF